MTSAAFVTILLHLVASPPSHAPTVLGEIDALHRRGAIDDQTRLLYRVAALRRPELLPDELRDLPLGREGGRLTSGTRVMVEAYQQVIRTGAFGGALHNLLQPPGDLPYVLDSATWPIRVSYRSPWSESLAHRTLQAAETSYEREIGEFGFYQPPTVDASGLYRIFVDDTGMGGGGYTAPFDYNPSTAWDDCFTYIVIDPTNDEWSVDGVVAHEVNHAMQAAMDCLEVTTFWENTATYVMSQVFPDAWWYTVGTMSYFQSQPWRALDFMQYPYSDLYEYGGALFVYYLAETFSPTGYPVVPKSVLLRKIWEASMQSTGFNEPDYYDAIETVLASDDVPTSMEELLMDFSEARYFVGSQDDGAHLPGASQLWDAELSLVAEHTSSALPVRGASPPSAKRPAPFGSNHVLVSFPSTYGHSLVVRFDGDDETRWGVRLVRFGRGTTVSEALDLAEETWDGSAVVETTGFTKLLLVIANLGDEAYDPDRRSWPVASYSYDVSPVLPAPVIEGIIPDVVARGQQNLPVRLLGSGFATGPEFFLRFEDPNVQVVSLDYLSATEILFSITVPQRTELGAKT
ncbi:MAG: hypothetical protein RBU30_04205, partial [Polyangia bacterium]|nr:hypothetical protein [Polyangia bacterium]